MDYEELLRYLDPGALSSVERSPESVDPLLDRFGPTPEGHTFPDEEYQPLPEGYEFPPPSWVRPLDPARAEQKYGHLVEDTPDTPAPVDPLLAGLDSRYSQGGTDLQGAPDAIQRPVAPGTVDPFDDASIFPQSPPVTTPPPVAPELAGAGEVRSGAPGDAEEELGGIQDSGGPGQPSSLYSVPDPNQTLTRPSTPAEIQASQEVKAITEQQDAEQRKARYVSAGASPEMAIGVAGLMQQNLISPKEAILATAQAKQAAAGTAYVAGVRKAGIEAEAAESARDITLDSAQAMNDYYGKFVDVAEKKMEGILKTIGDIENFRIDPGAAWHNKSLATKAFIGFGAGLFRMLQVTQGNLGGANPVVQALHNAMQLDLAGQQLELNKQFKVLGAQRQDLLDTKMLADVQQAHLAQQSALMLAGAKSEALRRLANEVMPIEERAKLQQLIGDIFKEQFTMLDTYTKTLGSLAAKGAKRAGRGSGGGGRRGKLGATIEGGSIRSPNVRIVVGVDAEGNEITKAFPIDITKGVERGKELVSKLNAADDSVRIYQSLLDVAESEDMDNLLKLPQTDPAWQQVRSRLADLTIIKQQLIKGIPSDKDREDIIQAIDGGYKDLVRVLRAKRAKPIWRNAIRSTSQQIETELMNLAGIDDEGNERQLRWRAPESSGGFKLELRGDKVPPRAGVTETDRGSTGNISADIRELRKPVPDFGVLASAAKAGAYANQTTQGKKELTTAAHKALLRVNSTQPKEVRVKAQSDYAKFIDALTTVKRKTAKPKELDRVTESQPDPLSKLSF